MDIFAFLNDKGAYTEVHNLDIKKKGFEWDYIQGNILLISIGLLGLLIIGLRFKRPNNNKIRNINFGLIGLFILTVTIGLIRFLRDEF
jgi:hypothetical protein